MMEITKYICKKTSLRGKYKWNQQERKSSVNCSLCLQLEEGAMLIKRNENISSSSIGDADNCDDDDNNNDGDNDISNNEMGRERKEERGKGGGERRMLCKGAEGTGADWRRRFWHHAQR